MMAGTSRGTVTPWRSLVVRTLSWVVTGTTVAFACTIARSRCTTTRSQRMPQRRRASWTKAGAVGDARGRGGRGRVRNVRDGRGRGDRGGRGRRPVVGRGGHREARAGETAGGSTGRRERQGRARRADDDRGKRADAMALRRRRAMRSARAEVCETGPPRKACRANPSPRARARRAHETRRRKTWVGEPSNNHTETKKKNARVVGCRKRRPQHTRARPVDRVRSPRRHRDGRRSRDDRAGLTRSLRRARSPSRALRCDGRATRVSRHGARGAPGQGGDDARFHTLATAHDAALAELAATLRAPDRYDWRDGRAAFDGGAPTVGGAAFDARRADAPGETSGRATPSTSPSTSPTPSTRAHATSRPHVDTSPPAVPTLEARARLRPPARARARPLRPVARSSPSPSTPAAVAAAALGGGVVVWHVPSGRLVDAFRFDDASEREANRQKKKPRDAPRASDVWWIGGGGGGRQRRRGRRVARRGGGRDPRASSPRTGRTAPRTGRTAPRTGPDLIGSSSFSPGGPRRAGHRRVLDVDGRRRGDHPVHRFAGRDGESVETRTRRRLADFGSFGSFHLGDARRDARRDASRHEAGLTCACVSGATLATCDARGEFRLWRLPNGDPTTTVRWGLDGDAILRCAFLPRGRKTFPEALDRDREPLRLATAHYSREDDRGRVLVWRIGDGGDPSREFAATKPRFREAVEPSPEESSTRASPSRATNET